MIDEDGDIQEVPSFDVSAATVRDVRPGSCVRLRAKDLVLYFVVAVVQNLSAGRPEARIVIVSLAGDTSCIDLRLTGLTPDVTLVKR